MRAFKVSYCLAIILPLCSAIVAMDEGRKMDLQKLAGKAVATIALVAIVASIAGATQAWASSHTAADAQVSKTAAIQKRIQPVGSVNVAATKSAATPAANDSAKAGKALYTKTCAVCHAAGVAGAPKLGDNAAWTVKVGDKTMAEIMAIVEKGKGAMPPQGTCMTCTPAQLQQAVEYMLNEAKIKPKH